MDTTPQRSNLRLKWEPTDKKIALIQSKAYTEILHSVMESVNGDRDILLSALYECFDFVRKPRSLSASANSSSNSSVIAFLDVVEPKVATYEHMLQFHTDDYLSMLCTKDGTEVQQEKKEDLEVLEKYGLVDENSKVATHPDLWKYCQYTAGASLQAANLLTSHDYCIAMNWGGGRHHATPSSASGFCFVNDIVLAIMHLTQYYDKVLYMDIDIHHGDGVQSAFYDDPNVLTVSFHRFVPGVFFPATPEGSIEFKGKDLGVGYNLNIPLPAQFTDTDFIELYQYTLDCVQQVYKPQGIVLCVGADGLHNDPLVSEVDPGWRLTPHGIQQIVHISAISSTFADQKLLLLGGGGYHPSRTALTHFLCTNAACEAIQPGFIKMVLPRDIPEHHIYWNRYGPTVVLRTDDDEEEEQLLTAKTNLCLSWKEEEEYKAIMEQAKAAINLAKSFIQCKEHDNKKRQYVSFFSDDDDSTNGNNTKLEQQDAWEKDCFNINRKTSSKTTGRRRKKQQKAAVQGVGK